MLTDNQLFHKTTKKFNSFIFPSSSFVEHKHNHNEKNNWEWYDPLESSNVAVEFCLESGLHGLKYIVKPRRHFCERLFWLLAFLISVSILFVLIWNSVSEYRTIPIVTVLNPTEKTLDEIPFPSVTICNVNIVRNSEVDRLYSNAIEAINYYALDYIKEDQLYKMLAKLSDINHICESTLPFTKHFFRNTSALPFKREYLETFSNGRKYAKYINPSATLENASQPCSEMIIFCMWLGRERDCSELFTPIETDFGLCCTFNTMPMSLVLRNRTNIFDKTEELKDWADANLNYDNLIFSEATKKRKYPRRQRYSGRRGGLSFMLNPDLNEYFCPNTDSQGFMMRVGSPLDVPQMNDNGLAIKTNAEVFVSVQPDIDVSDETVKRFQLETRKCYHGEEYHLRDYNIYTVSNCQAECITNYTRNMCNCSLYYMPQSPGIPLCRPKAYNCTENATRWILEHGLGDACEICLPTCTEVNYRKQVTHMRLQNGQLQELFGNNPEGFGRAGNASIVHVYFNMDSVYPKLRKETTSLIQLIANAGGLLGVCLGCSILSLLEICYHGTLRICCNWYRHKSNMAHVENIRVTERKFDVNSRHFVP